MLITIITIIMIMIITIIMMIIVTTIMMIIMTIIKMIKIMKKVSKANPPPFHITIASNDRPLLKKQANKKR